MKRRPGSGIYQFRKRLPKEFAGQVAPDHIKRHLSELIDADTGCFKRELVVSLGQPRQFRLVCSRPTLVDERYAIMSSLEKGENLWKQ